MFGGDRCSEGGFTGKERFGDARVQECKDARVGLERVLLKR